MLHEMLFKFPRVPRPPFLSQVTAVSEMSNAIVLIWKSLTGKLCSYKCLFKVLRQNSFFFFFFIYDPVKLFSVKGITINSTKLLSEHLKVLIFRLSFLSTSIHLSDSSGRALSLSLFSKFFIICGAKVDGPGSLTLVAKFPTKNH